MVLERILRFLDELCLNIDEHGVEWVEKHEKL